MATAVGAPFPPLRSYGAARLVGDCAGGSGLVCRLAILSRLLGLLYRLIACLFFDFIFVISCAFQIPTLERPQPSPNEGGGGLVITILQGTGQQFALLAL